MQKFRFILIFGCLLLSFPLFGQDDPFPQYQEVGRIGHGTLQHIAWFPDGERLAVVSTIGLFLYTSELELISHYEMDLYSADDLSWSPDGRYLNVKTYNPSYEGWHWQIYKVDSDEYTPQFTEFPAVTDLVWKEDQLLLIDSSRLYIIVNDEVVFAVDEPILQATWNATGTQLAITKDDVVTVYDGTTFEVVFTRRGFNGFWWSPDGERLALRSSAPFDDEDSGLLVIYDVASGDAVARLQGELLQNRATELIPQTMVREQIGDVLLHPDGCQVVAVHGNPVFTSAVVRVWDICSDETSTPKLVYSHSPVYITLFDWSARFDYFLSTHCCGTWIVPSGLAESVNEDQTIDFDGHQWQFSPDNRQLAVYGIWQGNVDFYDAETLELIDTYESRGNRIRSVRWSPDGERLAIGRVDSLEIIDANSKAVLAEDISFLTSGNLASGGIVSWDTSGRYLSIVSAGWTGRPYTCASVRVWDSHEQNFIASFSGYTPIYLTAEWLDDSAQLAISQKEFRYGYECDGESKRDLWDVETQELISTEPIEGNIEASSQIRGVESPDGRLMLVSSLEKIEIWRDTGGNWVLQSEIQPENLTYFSYASWHPDSQHIFFSAYRQENNAVFFMIANVETGFALTITSRQGLSFEGFTGFAWMPDNSGFVLSSSNGTVTIYEQVP